MVARTNPGGGFRAIAYAIAKAMEVGPWRLWKRMTARNACKTCALGMGGMKGGMVNESGHFPEVCKKSLQAQVADMKGALDADFFDKNDLESLLSLTPKQAEDAGRLSYPVIHAGGASHFRPASWDSAMELAADALKNSDPGKVAFYASGRSSNEAAFILQSFARVYGTNNIMNCSYYCHQASGVALKMTFGTGTATVQLDDLSKADLVMLMGANPASNHPRLMKQLADVRRRGGQVIVVNPVRESGLEVFHIPSRLDSLFFGSKVASLYVQPLAGGDVHFLVGVLKRLIELGQVNLDFLKEHAENYEAVLSDASQADWEQIVRGSGVAKETIAEVAGLLGQAKSAIFAWAMGLTHHESGVENVLCVSNLALATGQVGKVGSGMLPIRGHSNVQGISSIGFTPHLQDSVRDALARAYGRPLATLPGQDTYSMMEAAERGEIDALIVLGGNLWGSNPDLQWAERGLRKIQTIVYLSTKLNPGHFHGRGQTTVILPVLARDEEPEATTQESLFNFVRLSQGGTANVAGGMRSESAVICDLATRTLSKEPVDWMRLTNHKEVRRLIAEVIPGWQEIGQIDATGKEFTIGGRIFHTPQFNTASGKATMQRTPLPALDFDGLRLVTLRSEGQFNTVVYEEADIYRGIPHRYCILVSQQDTSRLGLKDGQKIRVRGEAGVLEQVELVVGKIRPGVVAMFFPEANVLIKPRVDKRSGTPAYKCAPVWLE